MEDGKRRGSQGSRRGSKSHHKAPAINVDSLGDPDQENKRSSSLRRRKKKLRGYAKACGVALDCYARMKDATGLSDQELVERHKEFNIKFIDGLITYDQFKEISREVIPDNDEELEAFCQNVFKMFDINGDKVLTFEEFTFATSAQNFDDPTSKLVWLFDHVYDKVHHGNS